MAHSSGFPIYALNLGPQFFKPLNLTSPSILRSIRLAAAPVLLHWEFHGSIKFGESDLFSVFTDLFFETPKPQSQPKPKSTPSQRQDELVKKFPGSKIIRRPNPMEEADDSTYIKFPEDDCGNYIYGKIL